MKRLAVLAAILMAVSPSETPSEWPAVTRDMRPWTRWWWMGSAVDPANLTAELRALRDAGLGGVEITPIYGVRGREAQFIEYLSPAWVERLEHTLREAQRLDLGVDMATGTGWPFGGPAVGAETACRTLVMRTFTVPGGERLPDPVRADQEPMVRRVAGVVEQVKESKPLPLQTLMAYSGRGTIVDLTSRVGADGVLDWIAPEGQWTLYALFLGWHGKLVERAAPGGEGNVIDHFSADAIHEYLSRFDTAFTGRAVKGVRAFFNDSYEVDDAAGQSDWTPAFLDEFQTRRGYDLRRYLPALAGRDTDDRSARVLVDYRETIADLLLERFTTQWRDWAHRRGAIVRNQAHGSPGNLLDLYAASDIPETEGGEILARVKWASSAAHVAGRPLVSAEAATWLGEHFRSTLADVRAVVDRFFLGGVNHIVYHGTSYSPSDAPWPGWLFYAAVEFNPRNSWWGDFASLNAYVARAQSFLQSGTPDNDVLLYFPFDDALAVRGRQALLEHFGGAQPPLPGSRFIAAAEQLWQRGYTFDFISDRQVQQLQVRSGVLSAGKRPYRALVVPAARFMPLPTLERLVALARDGAKILFFDALPQDVSGLHDLDGRRARFRALTEELRGRAAIGADIEALLARAGSSRETLVDTGLQFVRRRHATGREYFIANQGKEIVDRWLPLATSEPRAVLFDPMSGARGVAGARRTAGGLEVRIQVRPGESVIVVTDSRSARGDTFPLFSDAGPPQRIEGTWNVRFVSGGPQLPRPVSIDRLASWTTFAGEDGRRFSGTATYSIRFPRPPAGTRNWRLDLGDVRNSARARLNGRELGPLIGPAFTVHVSDGMLSSENQLDVDVTNLMANRIADLDRRGVRWKIFYNVNFAARLAENRGSDGVFTAAKWAPLESGLLGPVTLTPVGPIQ